MLILAPSKSRPCLSERASCEEHVMHSTADVHVIIGVFGIACASELDKCVTARRIRRDVERQVRLHSGGELESDMGTSHCESFANRSALQATSQRGAFCTGRKVGPKRGLLLALCHRKEGRDVHGQLRLHCKAKIRDIKMNTYGLEFARGLRGAGTSQRTRGPYLRRKEVGG